MPSITSVGSSFSSSNANGGIISWWNPGNAGNSDNAWAVAGSSTAKALTELLCVGGFDFSAIPDTATIQGIELSIERHKSSNQMGKDVSLRLTKNGVAVGEDKASPDQWPYAVPNEAVKVYGGSSDLWGESWTPAEVKSQLGVAFSGLVASGSELWVPSCSLLIDSIAVTVHYTE